MSSPAIPWHAIGAGPQPARAGAVRSLRGGHLRAQVLAGGTIMFEPAALNDRYWVHRATALIPAGAYVTVLGESVGTIRAGANGVSYPGRWVLARYTANGGQVEGWISPGTFRLSA